MKDMTNKYILDEPWKESIGYNFGMISFGYGLEKSNDNQYKINVTLIEISEYVKSDENLLFLFLTEKPRSQFIIDEKFKIRDFFISLATHHHPNSQCFVQKGGKYYWVDTYNPETLERGVFGLHFCKKNGEFNAILTLTDTIWGNVDYFESPELANYLVNIGFEPELAY